MFGQQQNMPNYIGLPRVKQLLKVFREGYFLTCTVDPRSLWDFDHGRLNGVTAIFVT